MTYSCIAASSDSLRTQYSHGLNTDIWRVHLNYQSQLTPRAFAYIHEDATASRLKVAPSQNKWKDQHTLMARSLYLLQPNLSFQVEGSHTLFIDRQSGFENDIRTQMICAGFTLSRPNFNMPIRVGIKQDKRMQQSDTGISYNTSLQVPRIRFLEYTHRIQGKLDGDNLDQRKNFSHMIYYQAHRQFYQETADTLNIQYRGLRRDYYISPEGDLERREDYTQSAENRLTYHIGHRTRVYILGRIVMHRLKIDLLSGSSSGFKRERKDLELFGSIHFRWQRDWMGGDFQLKHLSEDQRYKLAETLLSSPYSGSSLLKTPDNQSSISSYHLKTWFPIGLTDTLLLTTHFQKLQYDTPDEENFDDRDEIRWHTDLTHLHRFSPTIILKTQLSSHLMHLVYIYGEKSADNNWTRIFRFKPEITWRPSLKMRWKQSATVMANYVDYDFDSELAGVRSFLYRKYQLDDSVFVGFSRRTTALVNYRFESDENGKLIWSEWLEQKISDRQSHTFTMQIDYTPCIGWHIRPGYSFFIRRGYQYIFQSDGSQQKKRHLDFHSHGPMLIWHYHGKRLQFNFAAHTIRTKTLIVKRQIYTRLDFKMRWIL